jgi:hypothetical protein
MLVAVLQVPLEHLLVFSVDDACAGLACKLEIMGPLVLVARQGACPGDSLAGVGEVERRHLTRRGLRELQAAPGVRNRRRCVSQHGIHAREHPPARW